MSTNMFKLSKSSTERLHGTDPRIMEIVQLALTISPVDFGIPEHGGFRSASTQNELFTKGVSKCDGVKDLSKHQSGLAFDIYAYADGKANWNTTDLTRVAAAILQAASVLKYPLEWGGHWKSWKDMPHFQLQL
jgi:peptidoglycan L-alanyl-D-glutamate endopeptidase CwlK